jgi:hypothetical protein
MIKIAIILGMIRDASMAVAALAFTALVVWNFV